MILKLKILPKRKLQSTHLDFLPLLLPERNPQENEGLRLTDSESEFSVEEEDEYADFKRFRAVPKHDEFKWDLPENLAKYTNDHFNKFIPEKDLQESILAENPVPLILHPPRKMDKFMRDLIFEKRAGSIEVGADSNLVKLLWDLCPRFGP